MTRIAATLRCDVRLQARNGFYLAVAFLLAIVVVVIGQLRHLPWDAVIAPLILGNLSLATYMFMAGLVLLEKDEGTLEAQVVSPLRPGEYLLSKTISLTGLSLVENVIVALVACGADIRLGPLVAGIVTASALYCLSGFIAIARYDSINEFLFPSILYLTAFSLPILDYAGLWSTRWMYLHPFQAPLVLLTGTVGPLAPWQWLYGLGYSALWIGVALYWSRRLYDRFVVARAGTR